MAEIRTTPVAWIPGLKQAPSGMTVLVGRRYNQNRPNQKAQKFAYPVAPSSTGRVGAGSYLPAPLTEPDLWATHPAPHNAVVQSATKVAPARPTIDSHRLVRAVERSGFLAYAIRGSRDSSSGTPENSSRLPPSGLSANTSASCPRSTLNIMLPPSLNRRYPASSLLWGNPTSPQASGASRFLLRLLPVV